MRSRKWEIFHTPNHTNTVRRGEHNPTLGFEDPFGTISLVFWHRLSSINQSLHYGTPTTHQSTIIMAATAKSFDISHLPSLKDGMTVEQETTTRRKTCRFIMEAAKQLKFQSIAISTAMVFFHRFYAKHSFKTHDRFEVAVAAILLAGKTEETPRKLNSGKKKKKEFFNQHARSHTSQLACSMHPSNQNSTYFPFISFLSLSH